ncbi:antibiotic biosynthesis monooxygenase family protein [Actinoplanes sp. NPDC026619]|uniref:antibiotic biosynthesis monooxygenase family protein n=1 Tax=Actinoplanes sp. NPDC026619 TaxID=3155798 RepID=UPI0033D02571
MDTESLTDAEQRARILFSVRVAEERRTDFLTAYEKVRYSVAGVPGHVRDQICQSSDDPDQWLITSEWSSLADFFAWEKSDEHREVVRPMRDCYSQPEFRSFSVVAETSSVHP